MQMEVAEHSILHQIQSKIYAACLQTRGKQGASPMTAPGRLGTKTTNAGTFVTFDVPGAKITLPTAINNSGAVAGHYFDAEFLIHSFLRTSDSTITPFDPPGTSGCSPSTQTFCSSAGGITPDGTVVGSFSTSSVSAGHSYLRAPNGTITVFDAPGAQFTFGLQQGAINPAGTVTGDSSPPDLSVDHGFVARLKNMR
jgi:hypothetical protein